jgi:hypothetical protein
MQIEQTGLGIYSVLQMGKCRIGGVDDLTSL